VRKRSDSSRGSHANFSSRTQFEPARLGYCVAMHRTDLSTTEPPSETQKCYNRGKRASSETSRRIDAYFAFERVQSYSKHPKLTYRPRTSNKRAELERRPSERPDPFFRFAVKPFQPTHVDRTWSLHSLKEMKLLLGLTALAMGVRGFSGRATYVGLSFALSKGLRCSNGIQYDTGLGACGWYNTNSDYIGE
jgi:hypothetical protein